MQRAQEKETVAKAAERESKEAAAKRKEEEWHMPGFEPSAAAGAAGTPDHDPDHTSANPTTTQAKPVTVVQYLPRSAFFSGAPARLSFGGFNKETERNNKERVERERRVKAAAAAARSSDADVTDAEMASRLGGGGMNEDDDEAKKKKKGKKTLGGSRDGAAGGSADKEYEARGKGSAGGGGFREPPPLAPARREGKRLQTTEPDENTGVKKKSKK